MTETIYLCGKGKCCPEVTFHDNGEMYISEFGQTVCLDEKEVKELLYKLKKKYE